MYMRLTYDSCLKGDSCLLKDFDLDLSFDDSRLRSIVIDDTGKNGLVSRTVSIISRSLSASLPLVCLIFSHSTRSKFHNERLHFEGWLSSVEYKKKKAESLTGERECPTHRTASRNCVHKM